MDKGTEKTPEEIEQGRNTWDEWLNDMSDREQPVACNIDNPDCESCSG